MLNNMFCCVFLISLIGVVIFAGEYLYNVVKNKPKNENIRKGLIISIIVVALSFIGFGTTMEEEEDANVETKVEEKVEDEEVKEEPEEVVEPEEDENVDGYVNDDPTPSESYISDVDNNVEAILNDSFTSDKYKVEFTRDGNDIYIGIMSYEINLNGYSDEMIESAMEESGIKENHDKLAQSIKDVYRKYGFDVNVTIGLFDCNQTMFYITSK